MSLRDSYPVIDMPDGPWLTWQPARTVLYSPSREQYVQITMPWQPRYSDFGRIALVILTDRRQHRDTEVWEVRNRGASLGDVTTLVPTVACLSGPRYVVEEWIVHTGTWQRFNARHLNAQDAINDAQNELRRQHATRPVRVLEFGTNHVVAIFDFDTILPNPDLTYTAQDPPCYMTGHDSAVQPHTRNPENWFHIPATPTEQRTTPLRQRRAVRITSESRKRKVAPETAESPIVTSMVENIRQSLRENSFAYAYSRREGRTATQQTTDGNDVNGNANPYFMVGQDVWVSGIRNMGWDPCRGRFEALNAGIVRVLMDGGDVWSIAADRVYHSLELCQEDCERRQCEMAEQHRSVFNRQVADEGQE